jgi:hypothetical protein
MFHGKEETQGAVWERLEIVLNNSKRKPATLGPFMTGQSHERIVAIPHRSSRREETKIAQGETLGKLAVAEFPPRRGGANRKLDGRTLCSIRARSIRPYEADFLPSASYPGLRSSSTLGFFR